MRRLPALALIVLTVAALAACSASTAPGWTYAPAASAAPVASGGASGAPASGAPASVAPSIAPSVAPSVAPSAAPSAAESAAASGGTGGTGLTVKAPVGAATAGFDPTTLETTSGAAFTLTFDNEDNQAPHNVAIFDPNGTKVALGGDTAFFTGPGDRTYQVPALTAGTYAYKCEVHPTTMMGTLTVK
jgi:plastocyanin